MIPHRGIVRGALLAAAMCGLATSFLLAEVRRPQAAAPAGKVTYARDVAPIFFSRCAACHRPDGAAPFSLLSYASARARAMIIAETTRTRQMPPWKVEPGYGDFIGQRPLSDRDIATIQQWVRDGAPEGDPRDLPPIPRWTPGWQLGTPDLVVTFPQPYELPPAGTDVSRVFVIPLPVDRQRYVKGFEFRPGNARVVHHANIRFDGTRASRRLDDEDPGPGYDGVIWRSAVYPDGYPLLWTPGQISPLMPKGLGWRLDTSTDMVVQLHLVPTGKPEVIQPSIAFYFTDDPPDRTPVVIRLARQNIDIPAGARDYAITDSFVLPVDAEVNAVQPHAHYLAREVRGTATLPDGTTRPLLYIKDWDFRWQHLYRYVTPFWLPKGTTLSLRYTYDNSRDNPRNPQDPPERVVWGQRTKDEMGDLWIQVLARNDRERNVLLAAANAKIVAEDITGYENMIVQYPTRAQLHDDVGLLYLSQGRTVEAARHFAASVRLQPDSAAAHYNDGTVLMRLGRVPEAIGRFEEALRLMPDYALAHNNLGAALLRTGKADEALRHFREAVRLDPRSADARGNFGSLLRAGGDAVNAAVELRAAVELAPDSAPALASLASLLATSVSGAIRRPAEAVRLAERAAELTSRKDAGILDVLAAAYAADGQFAAAVATAQAALALHPLEPLAGNLQRRLELYEKGQPFTAR